MMARDTMYMDVSTSSRRTEASQEYREYLTHSDDKILKIT